MDQGVKQMVTMIEDDGASPEKKAEQTRQDLIAQVEEFFPSGVQMQGAFNSESGYDVEDFLLLTPNQKLGFQKTGHRVAPVSSHGGSSELSMKEGSESFSSSSSSDSESESSNCSGNAYSSLPLNTDRGGLHQKLIDLGIELPSMEEKLRMGAEENGEIVLNTEENGNYQELLARVIRYEGELQVSKHKLQLSGDEITRLKSELERRGSRTVLAGTLQAQLESAQNDIKMRVSDLEFKRERVAELEKQKFECTHDLQGHLRLAQEETTVLKAKLDSESRLVLDLQGMIECQRNDLSDRDSEIQDLKAALLDTQESFSTEKAHLESDIFSLSAKHNTLEGRLREWEVKGKILEEKLRRYEAEKVEMKSIRDAQEISVQGEISQLKAELFDRSGHVEVLNKNLDSLKCKYDVLMAEKDGMNAKVNTLVADMSSQDNQIKQMEVHLQQLHVEMIAGSESARKLVSELRLREVELENEVDRQKVEISAGAEAKKEAITQLCFSLDHYRSWYKELRQAFLAHKQQHVVRAM